MKDHEATHGARAAVKAERPSYLTDTPSGTEITETPLPLSAAGG